MFPVEVAYLKEPVPDYVRKAAEVVGDIHLKVRDMVHTGGSRKADVSLCSARSWRYLGLPDWTRRDRAMSRGTL